MYRYEQNKLDEHVRLVLADSCSAHGSFSNNRLLLAQEELLTVHPFDRTHRLTGTSMSLSQTAQSAGMRKVLYESGIGCKR